MWKDIELEIETSRLDVNGQETAGQRLATHISTESNRIDQGTHWKVIEVGSEGILTVLNTKLWINLFVHMYLYSGNF